jgi:hypothetical protein
MHSKKCLAEAIISAVQNLRDNKQVDDLAFRLAAQANEFLPEADAYLNDGLQTCTCGEYEESIVVEMFKNSPDDAQIVANQWLRDGKISPEGYLRIARQTRQIPTTVVTEEENWFTVSPERRAEIEAAVEDEHSHGGTPTLDDGCGK